MSREQLRLRPFRAPDAKTIIQWAPTEEQFYKWSAGILGAFPVSEERMLEATSGRYDNTRYFPFTLVDGDKVVGFFTLRHPSPDDENLRFGFVIVDPSVRGKGYGKRMMELGLKFAFEIYGVDQVALGVFVNNPGAYHCYKAAGFEENGISEDYEICGELWNCIDMVITK